MVTIVLYGIRGKKAAKHLLEFALSGEVRTYSTDIVVLLLLM